MSDLIYPWEPDDDCETHEWRSARQEVIRFVTRTETQGRMMPPVTLITMPVPQAHGGRFRSARHDERLVTLPVVLPGPWSDPGRSVLRHWAGVLDPAQGEGTLTVVQGPWAGRQLTCAYEAGLESFSEDNGELNLGTLAFRAAEPYWQDSIEMSLVTGLDPNAARWFPFLPLILGSSSIFAAPVIWNRGDVDAWPIVTVTGPGTDLIVTNQTTGLSWIITGSIPAGGIVTVDTRPGHKTATLDGANIFSRLTSDSWLWPLQPGANRVTIGFATVTPQSLVRFAWRNRWLAA
jgi:hypothetical protein